MAVFPRFRRLRCLSALALFAWLMLAVAPLGAWSHLASTPQASSTAAHASHASMHMHDAGCCDDHPGQPDRHATPSCPCAPSGAGVLPSTPARLAGMTPVRADYAPPRPIEAPLSGFAPPLRPPLA